MLSAILGLDLGLKLAQKFVLVSLGFLLDLGPVGPVVGLELICEVALIGLGFGKKTRERWI